MHPKDAEQELILRGLATVETATCPSQRLALLEAASRLLVDEALAHRCSVTAAVIREAESAQLRLFQSLRN